MALGEGALMGKNCTMMGRCVKSRTPAPPRPVAGPSQSPLRQGGAGRESQPAQPRQFTPPRPSHMAWLPVPFEEAHLGGGTIPCDAV